MVPSVIVLVFRVTDVQWWCLASFFWFGNLQKGTRYILLTASRALPAISAMVCAAKNTSPEHGVHKTRTWHLVLHIALTLSVGACIRFAFW